jgi:hypothetical protein
MEDFSQADDPGGAPPPEYDTRPDSRSLTPFARRQELIGRFIDSAEILDSGLAMVAAARARAIDELRRVSEAIAVEEQAEDAAKPPELRANRHQDSGWSIQNRARTELTTEIAVAFTVSKGAARLLIEESATLVADLPLTLDALETGSVRYEHAKLIASTAWSLPTEARAPFEEEALPWAKTLILSAFRAKLLTLREKHHTETMRERHEKATAFRTVTLEPGEDGIGFLTLRDSIETLTAIYNRITDIALPKAKDDPRTLAQRRVDVASEILLNGDLCASVDGTVDRITDGTGASSAAGSGTGTATGSTAGTGTITGGRPLGHGVSAQVHITVPVLTLLGRDDEPATLDGTIPIDPATARTLVANAPGFFRVLTDPITGSIVSFDDRFRYLPKSLRRAVQLIDGTCTSPWCNAPAHESDGHHPDEWAHSHNTSLENSALACTTDHQLIHNTRWSMSKLPNGDKEWISPSGRVHRVPPQHRLSPAFVQAARPRPDAADSTSPPAPPLTPQPATRPQPAAQPDEWHRPAEPDEELPF